MSHLTQMAGLTVQNFLSAATGIAVAVAADPRLRPRLGAQRRQLLGRPHPDHALRAAAALGRPRRSSSSRSGMPQTLAGVGRGDDAGRRAADHRHRAGRVARSRSRCSAPTAAASSTPTPRTRSRTRRAVANLIQMVAIFAIGAALTNVFGRMVGDERQGWAILAAMGAPLPRRRRRRLLGRGRRQPAACTPSASTARNMEGKEVRFGPALSALFAVITTAASCGAVNAMHDSFTPLGGLIPLINMQLGEIIVGGVGAGLYGMLIFVLLAIFIAGLMVGRTPEYLGKKIEAREVKLAMLAILSLPLAMLGFTAIAVVLPRRRRLDRQPRPARLLGDPLRLHLGGGNNGSAFARADRQHALVQPDARRRHADGPLPRHHPGPRHRRLARRQEDRPGLGRHLSHRRRPLRRPPRRRHPDRRRPHLLPGPRARPHGRAPRDDAPARPSEGIASHGQSTHDRPRSRRRSSSRRSARPSPSSTRARWSATR